MPNLQTHLVIHILRFWDGWLLCHFVQLLLDYVKKDDEARYKSLIERLGIRK